MLEKLLERIAVALEALVALKGGSASDTPAPAPAATGKRGRKPAAAPEPEASEDPTDLSLGGEESSGDDSSFLDDEPEPEAEEVTKETVRAELVSLQTLTSAAVAQDVLKRIGKVESLGKLPEAKFAAVIAEAKKLAAAAAAKKAKK